MKIIKSELLLMPLFLHKIKAVIKEHKDNTGENMVILETYRTQERQDSLYAKGRTAPGDIVTSAKRSFHTLGMACDLICDNDPIKGGIQDPYKASWEALGSTVLKHGLVWGGNWGDNCHIQIMGPFQSKTIWEIADKQGILTLWHKVNLYYNV